MRAQRHRLVLYWSLLLAAATGAGCASAGNVGGSPDLSAACGDGMCGGVGCNTETDCKNGLHCDLKIHQCVPCSDDSQCPGGLLCSPLTHSCQRGCNAQHPECGDAGICDPVGMTCVQCFSDGDCKDPASPHCATQVHQCYPCLPDADTCPQGTYCAQAGNGFSCAAGCKSDNECGNGCAPADGGVDAGCIPVGKCVNHNCSSCKVDNDCSLGKICKGGSCVDGCSNLQGCPGGQACCGQKCADVTNDYQNCGMCGHVCPNGNNCCNSTCSNPQNDIQNCNACGNTCMFDNSIAACVLRQCTIAMCNPGWKDCNASLKDGCETNVDGNINNCGACNNPCQVANGVPKCMGGMCGIATCTDPYDDCDMNPKNGCETNTNKDAKNCGGCGMACVAMHDTPNCVQGSCNVGVCDPGWVDCNKNPGDGCETDITTDVMNCGGCGKVCASNNATASCLASTCQLQCNKGFGDCDNNPANGCEVNLNTDASHCGGCNLNCNNGPPHVTQTGCGNGVCAIQMCQGGFFDVDGNFNNGCECQGPSDSNACNAPTGLGQVNLGGSVTRTSNLVPQGREAWYQVTFVGNANKAYHPLVKLTTNPNNAFAIDVRSDCAGNTPTCGEGGVSNGRTSWEVYYTGGDPNTPSGTFAPISPVGNNGTVYVRVYRANGGVTCDNFVLTASN